MSHLVFPPRLASGGVDSPVLLAWQRGGWLSFLDPYPQGSAIDSSGLIIDLGRCLLKLGGEI